MILTREEERAALDSIIDLLTRGDFRLTNVTVDSCSREVESDVEGQKKFVDTGVRIVTVVMNANERKPDSYGAMVSEDAGPSISDRLREAEAIIHNAAFWPGGPAESEASQTHLRQVAQDAWSYIQRYMS